MIHLRVDGAFVRATGLDNNVVPLRERELRVVLASEHLAARLGIRRAIEPHAQRVVAEAGTAGDAVRFAVEHEPDVCVLTVSLPGDGIEAARLIRRSIPATKIVMLTAVPRNEDLFAALRAGADGYLLMSTSASRLPHAIRGVVAGEAALPRTMTARLIREFRESAHRRRLLPSLSAASVEVTAREFEVVERLRKRERTSEIAAALGISEVTVRRHVSAVLQKLGAPSRRNAIELLENAERLELQDGPRQEALARAARSGAQAP